MNVARTCKADEVRVRLCFFVKVLKASGRKVAGGSIMGSILAFVGMAAELNGRMGCTGVANAGDDEGIGFNTAGVLGTLKIGAVLLMIAGISQIKNKTLNFKKSRFGKD